MFHASDIILVWARSGAAEIDPKRSFAFRDFYQHEATKLGEVQTMGMSAGYGVILTRLHQMFDRSALRHLPVLKAFLRVPAFAAEKIFNRASVFSSIVEDYPYPDNRVMVDESSPSGIRCVYNITSELRSRVKLLRRLLKSVLNGHRVITVNEDCSLNFGHPCGTCRAGEDPATSVVDGTCKVHHTSNVYVTDGSFMPTSGGTNPSLTIAANALRVADVIADRLQNGEL
jgi:choline dehydrogenase-like flavoprotein